VGPPGQKEASRLLMDGTGTKERKRAIKAMPPRIELTSPGCAVAFLAYLATFLILYWKTGSPAWLALAAPGLLALVLAVVTQVRSVLLLAKSRRLLESRGIRCLVVYSESPNWEDHIRNTWLPRLGERAVTLNWSQRSTWPTSLEVRLFRQFIQSRYNFNPVVLVFRGIRRPHVFRFYYAFQQAQHGRRQYLQALETELFDELGL